MAQGLGALLPLPMEVETYHRGAAATLLPAYSEVVFAGMLSAGYAPLALWAWATAGNTLGAVLNYVLGRFLLHFQDRRWFPFRPGTLERSQRWFQRYGVWSLLMAWAPVGGDALTFVAGVMRVRFTVFRVADGVMPGPKDDLTIKWIEVSCVRV